MLNFTMWLLSKHNPFFISGWRSPVPLAVMVIGDTVCASRANVLECMCTLHMTLHTSPWIMTHVYTIITSTSDIVAGEVVHIIQPREMKFTVLMTTTIN